eukprot:gb/GEZN01008611.1/.p1 GENE.gb/GEZN01008611.1/~~gb/GEZN01008611.1/.p1  ORF type:complete len:115 (-),score=12.25 gb/GEZN01008611.1/:213-557(-)
MHKAGGVEVGFHCFVGRTWQFCKFIQDGEMESPHFFSGVVGVSADSFDPSKPSLDFSKLGKQRRRGKSDKRLQKAAASLFGVAPSKGAPRGDNASPRKRQRLPRSRGLNFLREY